MGEVRARRVYEEPETADGTRVLVDRLWPRGLAKAKAHLDEWLKAVAPSTELRRWYGHDPAKFDEFRRRYGRELEDPEPAAALQHLRELTAAGPVTLLTATKDLARSEAADLAERLQPPAAPGAQGSARDRDSASDRAGAPVQAGARDQGSASDRDSARDQGSASDRDSASDRAGAPVQAGARDRGSAAVQDSAGDPACWLSRVCPNCGTMPDDEPPTTCPRCHTPIPVP